LDFFKIAERLGKNRVIEVYPDFKACRSKDLMIRGRSFYAIWDEEKHLWSSDEYDVQRLVDHELELYKVEREKSYDGKIVLKKMISMETNMWKNYKAFVRELSDNAHDLDTTITFANTEVKRTDYTSKKLSYPLEQGSIEAYDELMSTLYIPDERAKLEWSIGAIISGDAKKIQKFVVLYGDSGAGKSTFLNIVQKLFAGYYTMFVAKTLTSNGNFATEAFKDNPLIAIEHDGDLSKIEDNTKLNSIVSHEEIVITEKFKPKHDARANAMLFIGTNKPIHITDAKSGIIRRLIDVKPSGKRLSVTRYDKVVSKINFELGAIAYHCLQTYRKMGKDYYNGYKPVDMMMQTDIFFNFIEDNYFVFKQQDSTTLSQAYDMYKVYCDEASIPFKQQRHKFREELKSYFEVFSDMTRIDGKQVRSYYSGFIGSKMSNDPPPATKEELKETFVLDKTESLIDKVLSKCPAQYTSKEEAPKNKWEKVKTTLKDIDTKKIHYVMPPNNHIVIDFDLKDAQGNKSKELNLQEASKWPKTYAEFSKGGGGIHLHYNYIGDVTKLSRVYSEDIEVKIFNGNSSLRRRLSFCNNSPVADISSGLPLKGDSKMLNFDAVKSEKGLRDLIMRNLHKEIHPGTKPSIDFIYKILEDAYVNGIHYDVNDMRSKVLTFAMSSSHQADYCIKLMKSMKFQSEEVSESVVEERSSELVFFDVEVFPNLFIVCFKIAGEGKKVVKMINPTAAQIEPLLKMMLVGFNCRRYDNHIIYAAYIGYTNKQLYDLSQKIINTEGFKLFGEAYNLSHTDVYDFASAGNKKGLKKWQLELGIHHQENHLSWDEPVPENKWEEVADYCANDVLSTEVVFNHLGGDWAARQILALLSGLTNNDTTNTHTTKIVFGRDNIKTIKPHLQYTDLSIMFPGYKFENGKSTYRGIEVGEGGYVEAIPGMYFHIPVLDIASMHPSTIELLNLFGPYTKRYVELKRARLAIKHKDRDALAKLLDGLILPFYDEAVGPNPRFTLKDISNALKTALNSAYGLTSAKFDNAFKDPRNKDNIVAKRGALFMIDLKFALEEKGYDVIHIKTDSVKLAVPEADSSIIDFIFEFGKKYGYDFEQEETYSRFCLVNNAVYIARVKDWEKTKDIELIAAKGWTATGTQFAHPYVFKTLFSKQPIHLEDLSETKSVSGGALYIDMDEGLGVDEHAYQFIGKVGAFLPIKPGCGGGVLYRFKDEKYFAATGTKGYRWMEVNMVKSLGKEKDIDMSYYESLAMNAKEDIQQYGDFDWFICDSELPMYSSGDTIGMDDVPPWLPDCPDSTDCCNCKQWEQTGKPGPNKCKLGYSCMPF
jgi:energy-coupling factor transporter ATP-binding protein EcfA2